LIFDCSSQESKRKNVVFSSVSLDPQIKGHSANITSLSRGETHIKFVATVIFHSKTVLLFYFGGSNIKEILQNKQATVITFMSPTEAYMLLLYCFVGVCSQNIGWRFCIP